MFAKWAKISLVLTLVIAMLAGCGGQPASTASSASASGSATASTKPSGTASSAAASKPAINAGNRVKIAQWNPPTGLFHPDLLTSDYDSSVTGLIFESLVEFTPKFEYEAQLAESWEFSADSLSVTFKLKECNWHDGKPFTAEDVKFSLEFVGHKDYQAAGGTRYSNVEAIKGMKEFHEGKATSVSGIEIIDPHTIKITTTEVLAPFLYHIGGRPIMPKHIWEKVEVATSNKNTAVLQKPIGTGPFKFVSFVPDSHVVLDANPEFHDGKPKVEGVVIMSVSQNTATAQMIKGEIDMMGVSDFNPDSIKQFTDAKIDVLTAPLVAVQYMGVNNRLEQFSTKEVRQALMHGINRQGIVDGLYYGKANVANNPFPPTSWAYPGEDVLKNKYEYNPDKAIELMKTAGFSYDKDKKVMSDKAGKPVVWTLKYPSGNKAREDYAVVIQNDLKKIGITINLEIMEFAKLSDEVKAANFELMLMGMGTSFDGDQKYIWYTDAGYNYAGWTDKESDRLLDEGMKYLDQAKRKEAYKQWAIYMNENVPNVWLLNWYGGTAVSPKLKNVQYYAGGSYYKCENWEFTK